MNANPVLAPRATASAEMNDFILNPGRTLGLGSMSVVVKKIMRMDGFQEEKIRAPEIIFLWGLLLMITQALCNSGKNEQTLSIYYI